MTNATINHQSYTPTSTSSEWMQIWLNDQWRTRVLGKCMKITKLTEESSKCHKCPNQPILHTTSATSATSEWTQVWLNAQWYACMLRKMNENHKAHKKNASLEIRNSILDLLNACRHKMGTFSMMQCIMLQDKNYTHRMMNCTSHSHPNWCAQLQNARARLRNIRTQCALFTQAILHDIWIVTTKHATSTKSKFSTLQRASSFQRSCAQNKTN